MPKPGRGSGRSRVRTSVEEAKAPAAQTKAPAATELSTPEADGLWSVAMLRIAMELKRPNAAGLDAIIDGVVTRMGIPKDRFEKFLAEHLPTLREAARRGGYVR